jgi:ankyrin repeat protein
MDMFDDDDHPLNEDLLFAAGWGRIDRVRECLAGGASVHAKSDSYETALHLAAETGNADICTLLLEAGARTDGFNKKGNTPLAGAAGRSELACCKVLIDAGVDVNLRNDDGESAVHSASKADDPEVLRLLIAAGADVRVYDKSGYSPLHFAALFDHAENARALVQHGLSPSDVPSVPGEYCVTPFQRAAQFKSIEVCRFFMLECGESLDQKTADGRTIAKLLKDHPETLEKLRAVATETAVELGIGRPAWARSSARDNR